ncbi:MazG-like family protein [Nonomuraea sp. NBC_01738]|uniref:MazG-like family protein n=1 Tax=Nonomuraea sp. NBC_01738 TaxID=2976003 RepID=UPI002E0E3D1B|nr:MazG-like family protein [Nonomuraea sp. NBC_01738]
MTTSPALTEHVAVLLTWLDANNPRTDHEISMRVMKVGEEFGEVVSAYIGMNGQNPSKGHTRAEVSGELCDVIVSALIALATITGDAHTANAALNDHVAHRSPHLLKLIKSAKAARLPDPAPAP